MKKLLAVLSLLSLSACFDDVSDLKEHIQNVQASASGFVQPMPEVPKFDHFDYSSRPLRSPFDAPKPEAIEERIQQIKGCLSPDPQRKKQPLEKYALSDLVMRGTLGEENLLLALVQASDASLHRVVVGSYMGLYHGRVTAVSQEKINIMELIPDGAGCWIERETIVSMVSADPAKGN